MAAAGLPRWWSQDQSVLHQPPVKAKSYNEGAERAEPIDEPIDEPGLPTWYRRQSSALLDINAATKTASAHVTPTTSPTLPSQSVATESAASPTLPIQSVATESVASPTLPSQSVATESAASPTLPSQSVTTESAAPALSPVERLKEWQKFAKDSLSDFYCVGPRPNKSYGCLQSRKAIAR